MNADKSTEEFTFMIFHEDQHIVDSLKTLKLFQCEPESFLENYANKMAVDLPTVQNLEFHYKIDAFVWTPIYIEHLTNIKTFEIYNEIPSAKDISIIDQEFLLDID